MAQQRSAFLRVPGVSALVKDGPVESRRSLRSPRCARKWAPLSVAPPWVMGGNLAQKEKAGVQLILGEREWNAAEVFGALADVTNDSAKFS